MPYDTTMVPKHTDRLQGTNGIAQNSSFGNRQNRATTTSNPPHSQHTKPSPDDPRTKNPDAYSMWHDNPARPRLSGYTQANLNATCHPHGRSLPDDTKPDPSIDVLRMVSPDTGPYNMVP